jgi:hypothetical protein
MMKKSLTRAAALMAATSVAFTLSTTAASAADPRTLPSGTTLCGISHENPANQLYSISGTDAGATPIGVASDIVGASSNVGPAAWDAATKKAYYLLWNSAPDGIDELATIDRKTGIATKVADFSISGTPVDDDDNNYLVSIAIAPNGTAYAIAKNADTQNLYSLDLTTGALTLVAASPATTTTSSGGGGSTTSSGPSLAFTGSIDGTTDVARAVP